MRLINTNGKTDKGTLFIFEQQNRLEKFKSIQESDIIVVTYANTALSTYEAFYRQ